MDSRRRIAPGRGVLWAREKAPTEYQPLICNQISWNVAHKGLFHGVLVPLCLGQCYEKEDPNDRRNPRMIYSRAPEGGRAPVQQILKRASLFEETSPAAAMGSG